MQLKAFLEKMLCLLGIDEAKGLATIHGYHPESAALYFVAHAGDQGLPSAYRRQQRAFSGEGIVSWVAVHRRSLIINDVSDERFSSMLCRFHEHGGSESATPIFAGERLIGVLNFESYEGVEFSRWQMVNLSFVANQVGLAWQVFNERCIRDDLRRCTPSSGMFCGARRNLRSSNAGKPKWSRRSAPRGRCLGVAARALGAGRFASGNDDSRAARRRVDRLCLEDAADCLLDGHRESG